jgi:hypothetical protein
MDRYAIALNKKPTDIESIKKPAESVEPACHYECKIVGKSSCAVESSLGWLCSRSAGHKGPHVACAGAGMASNHERHIWYLPGEDILAGEGPYR